MTFHGDENISLDVLLRNVSGEIQRLSLIAQRLDDSLGAICASDADVTKPTLELQEVDALRQSLEALLHVSSVAAAGVPEDTNILLSKHKLASGVTLEKVREACLRTHSLVDAPEAQTPQLQTDEAMFFDEF